MTYRLADVAQEPLPEGKGIRIAGGRKVYPDCGWMWRTSPRQCFVAGIPFNDNWHQHEKSRRYLPDDTSVEYAPLNPSDHDR